MFSYKETNVDVGLFVLFSLGGECYGTINRTQDRVQHSHDDDMVTLANMFREIDDQTLHEVYISAQCDLQRAVSFLQ